MDKHLALVLGIIIGLVLVGFTWTSISLEQLKEIKSNQEILLKTQMKIKEEIVMLRTTDQTFATSMEGNYWDVVTLAGCSSDESNHMYAWWAGINNQSTENSISVFPNPSDGMFTLSNLTIQTLNFDIAVISSFGETVLELKNVPIGGSTQKVIDLRTVSDGIYSIILKNNRTQLMKKIVVTK